MEDDHEYLEVRVRPHPVSRAYWVVEVRLYEDTWSRMSGMLDLYGACHRMRYLNGEAPLNINNAP